MFEKRGQITLFIILGVIILVLVLVVSYVFTSSSERSVSEFSEQTRISESSLTSLKQVLQSCFVDSLNRGLDLLSSQGGVIYLDQGGKFSQTLDPLPVSFNYYLVSFGLVRSSRNLSPYYFEVPKYPYLGFPLGNSMFGV